MEKYKFISLLTTLSRREVREFDRYLQGYYAGKGYAIRLFQFFRELYPHLEHPKKMQFDYIYQAVFQEPLKQEKDRIKLLNSLSDLYLRLKEFLLMQELKNADFERELLWFQVLKKRKLDKRAEHTLEQLKKTEEQSKQQTIWHYYKMMWINYHTYFRSDVLKLMPREETLSEGLKYLDLFYVVGKLLYGYEAKSRSTIVQEGLLIELQEELLELAEQESDHELVGLFYLSYQLVQTQDEKVYQELKERLKAEYQMIAFTEQQFLLTSLINYAALGLLRKRSVYLREVFELYQFGIDSKIILNSITTNLFNNIVSVAIGLEEFKWLELVLPIFKECLPIDTRANAIQLANAQMKFGQKDYAETVRLLQNVEFNNVFDRLRASSLLLRCYVDEKEDIELILNNCRAFRQFLNRNKKLGNKNILSYKNFIRIVEHLQKEGTTSESIRKLLATLDTVACTSWIEHKINGMGKLGASASEM